MPPKRIRSLRRTTAASKRVALHRDKASEQNRQQRLAEDQARHAAARNIESQKNREQRLAEDRARHTASRNIECKENRQKRLAEDRTRHTASRNIECKENRQKRLAEDRARHSAARNIECQENRQQRLSEDQARHSAARNIECQENRQQRLAEDRARHAAARNIESQENREQRLAEDRARHTASRNIKCKENRQKRLAEDRARHTASRNIECQENRQKRLAGDRARHSAARNIECQENLQKRLAEDRARHTASRNIECQENRQKRLAEDRARHTAARNIECKENRQQRLTEDRARHAAARNIECQENLQKRLAEDRARHAATRNIECQENRQHRLSQNQARSAAARETESQEQQLQRLAKNRARKAVRKRPSAKSPFHVPGAAFQYNPKVDYEADSFVQIGFLSIVCLYCRAKKFPGETQGMCCSNGKVKLLGLELPPQPLKELLEGQSQDAKHFLKNIRPYNSAFQMTSFGAPRGVVEPGFMPTFKVQGQVHHLIGSLLPLPGADPQFLQIYFVGNNEEECSRRLQNFQNLDRGILLKLQELLHTHNSLVRSFKTAMEQPQETADFRIVISADKRPSAEHERRFNAPNDNEVAILMVGEPSNNRDIVIKSRDNSLQRVASTHRSYDALQYPLIFWKGQDGYCFNISQVHPETGQQVHKKKVSCNDFYAYMLMIRTGEMNPLLYARDLFHQFLVDMFVKVESERLLFIKNNQKKLRVENYVHLRDALAGDGDITNMGQLVILPSSYTGGPRYMHERTQDAMIYVRTYGRPDLFITFTCNPQWDEIQRELLPGQKYYHRHDLIARVFQQKLKKLMALITKHSVFGPVIAFIYTIEWQKRGLPHAHCLIWLENKIYPSQIDSVISAEIPDKDCDPVLFEIILKNMVHGPCGVQNMNSPCMREGKCSKRYPKQFLAETQTGEDGYPSYRRRMPEHGGFNAIIQKSHDRDIEINNRWIVPYCPLLSKIFKTHINVEYCSSVKSIKYVCKYVNKGCDMAMFGLQDVNKNDEVTRYQMGRYISSNEAVWRLLNFHLHERQPTVVHLDVHLENGQRVYYDPSNPQVLQEQLAAPRATKLTAFFSLCQHDQHAATLLYSEVPQHYTWQQDAKKWQRRVSGRALGRVYTVHPQNPDCYYLRLLLHNVRGPTSFQALKTVCGQICQTYRQACQLRGLLEDDAHWNLTLCEASVSSSPSQLRNLYAIMLTNCEISNPRQLWENHKVAMSEDILHKIQKDNPGMDLSYSDVIFNKALIILEDKVLQLGGKKLDTYELPVFGRDKDTALGQEMLRERNYSIEVLQAFVAENEPKLLEDQRTAYNKIIDDIEKRGGKLFFLDAPGGTGKTFLLNLLLAKIRRGGIALAVASSGIAATLLTGGRTAHSAFKIPLNLTKADYPACNISRNSAMAKVLQQARLIVWDECTMVHRKALEAVEKILRDIRGCDNLMGGLTVVLAGDFRQTLPVIPKGTKTDELNASLKTSILWQHIQKLEMKKNMRAHLFGDSTAELFSQHLLAIGNGKLPLNNQLDMHQLPCGHMVKTIDELKAKVFANISVNYKDSTWLCERAILAPKNDEVEKINLDLLKILPEIECPFKSVDTVVNQNDAVEFPTEFLNSVQPPGMPPHNLILKKGAPVMLLRNLEPPRLCNGTRLIIKNMKPHVIQAMIITGRYKSEIVFIPRIPLIPSDNDLPFQFKRLQFPLKLSFAMSINKSQGQSLKVVGLDLMSPCFSHGQLYVGYSRVGSPQNLYIYSRQEGFTKNIVYLEAFQ